MKACIIILLFAFPSLVFGEQITATQVRKHLVDTGKISSMRDESMDAHWSVVDRLGAITLEKYDTKVLGSKPDTWPTVKESDDAAAMAVKEQQAKLSAQPEIVKALISVFTKKLIELGSKPMTDEEVFKEIEDKALTNLVEKIEAEK